MGFLFLLERLTPIERAVLVLHDALGYRYATSPRPSGVPRRPAGRRCTGPARHVTVPARRRPADQARAAAVTERFLAAGVSGDVDALLAVLAPDSSSRATAAASCTRRCARSRPAAAARFLAT